jgi:orotidine-5'-phosphate decarboxylase
MSLIDLKKSIVPACDLICMEDYVSLIKQTHDLDFIGGYKVGFSMGLAYGLENVVSAARDHTGKPLIYDHQKAGTDIPDTGEIFAEVMSLSGINGVILFPQAGPATAESWVKACQDKDLTVIMGIIMTHEKFMFDRGGFIDNTRALQLFEDASMKWGVKEFVIPGNHPFYQGYIRSALSNHGDDFVFHSPGAVESTPHIDHYIVGRKIYQGADPSYRVNACRCQDLFL